MNGSIDIWDFQDSSNHPSFTPAVASTPLTSLEFRLPRLSKRQHLAVGDAKGSLHVLDIPQNLRKGPSNEAVRLVALSESPYVHLQCLGSSGVSERVFGEGGRARGV